MLQKKYLPIAIIIFSIVFSAFYYLVIEQYINKKINELAYFMQNNPKAVKLIKNLDSPYDKLARPEPVRQEYINTLYQMMKDIHDTLEVTKIEYWADFGTLLGLVRNHGIIPWDDDLDIQISVDNDKIFMEKAAPILRKLGYEVVRYKTWIKVHAGESKIELADNENKPTCDVFTVHEKNNRLNTTGWEHGIEIKDWKPLQLEQFGPIKIWRNNNPTNYLDALYGKNWNKLAVRGDNHQFKDDKGSAMPFAMKEEDYRSALPNKELIDHKKKIESLYQGL